MNRIKRLREEKGLTQSELGEILHVKDSAISKYESEKIPLTAETLRTLSKIFDVSIDYILGMETERHPQVTELKSALDELSPEAKKKANEYIEMLKKLDEVGAHDDVIDFKRNF
ncbi:helix-turn-helix transcriptional regulator [Sinanaerobacter sp. ZZT-01]|uniref:helix-turn-helix domain-containing protein n=1 Tax=Sinanaerobacter sp. ZZT-01 TaxID=3111540 RepID=UPI002D79B578|nr:helix-turn-helix transcriptional regulator [Sinanaerobacter sp. ZZT-01]WRR94223.1 helix-turn-helix transcriptional regulator [Sinanaerobacter sp. ZZT-01]